MEKINIHSANMISGTIVYSLFLREFIGMERMVLLNLYLLIAVLYEVNKNFIKAFKTSFSPTSIHFYYPSGFT